MDPRGPHLARALLERPERAGIVAPVVLLVLCAVGILVSGLSTRDHVRFRVSGGTQALACATLVDSGCKAAHTSESAEILGVPISHYGTAFYLGCGGLGVLALIRRRRPTDGKVEEGMAPIVVLLGLGAVGYSAFLATLLVHANQACPLCIALYGVNASLLTVGLVWWLRLRRRPRLRPMLTGGAVAVVIGGGFFVVSTPSVRNALAAPPARTRASVIDTATTTPLQPFALPDRAPSKGSLSALDELIEFSDLECPHCGALHRTVSALFDERGPTGLRVSFVNYPLDPACNPHVSQALHPTACVLARGGICAQKQGRFWPFVDAVFALEAPRLRTHAIDTARKLGLDVERFSACLDDASTVAALAEDIALAHRAGVRATPTMLVNGHTIEGTLPGAALREILDSTTPCGCDQRSPDGTCSPPPNAAPIDTKE